MNHSRLGIALSKTKPISSLTSFPRYTREARPLRFSKRRDQSTPVERLGGRLFASEQFASPSAKLRDPRENSSSEGNGALRSRLPAVPKLGIRQTRPESVEWRPDCGESQLSPATRFLWSCTGRVCNGWVSAGRYPDSPSSQPFTGKCSRFVSTWRKLVSAHSRARYRGAGNIAAERLVPIGYLWIRNSSTSALHLDTRLSEEPMDFQEILRDFRMQRYARRAPFFLVLGAPTYHELC